MAQNLKKVFFTPFSLNLVELNIIVNLKKESLNINIKTKIQYRNKIYSIPFWRNKI